MQVAAQQPRTADRPLNSRPRGHNIRLKGKKLAFVSGVTTMDLTKANMDAIMSVVKL